MSNNNRSAHISGMWLAIAALITTIGGILLTDYLSHKPHPIVDQKPDITHKENIPIYAQSPKAKAKDHMHIVIFTQDENGNALAGVGYQVDILTGFSDDKGQIEIDVAKLNAATDYDMFPITLKKEGYDTITDHIGITENSTLKLHKHDKNNQ